MDRSLPQPLEIGGPSPDLDVIDKLMKSHGLGNVIANKSAGSGRSEYLMFVFLYVRGVPQYLPNEKRTSFFNKIQEDGSNERKRLQGISSFQDRTSSHHGGICLESWEPKYPFTVEAGHLPMWSDDNHSINKKIRLIFGCDTFMPNQAIQKSKICYLQAAITLMAYSVMHVHSAVKTTQVGGNSTEDETTQVGETSAEDETTQVGGTSAEDEMTQVAANVDVAQYIRHTFSAEQLYNRIQRNKGGKAVDVFKSLSIGDTHNFYEIEPDYLTQEEIFANLIQYGAGLVGQFQVEDAFHDPEIYSYARRITVDATLSRGHAMVLVGA